MYACEILYDKKLDIFTHKAGLSPINWTFWPKMFEFGVIYHIYLVELIHICVNKHGLQTNKKVCTHVKYYIVKKTFLPIKLDFPP